MSIFGYTFITLLIYSLVEGISVVAIFAMLGTAFLELGYIAKITDLDD